MSDRAVIDILCTNYNNVEACSVVLKFQTILKMSNCIFVYGIIFLLFQGIRNATLDGFESLLGILVQVKDLDYKLQGAVH